MQTGKATLTNYRQPPRKVRLLVDMVRGKEVREALTALKFTPKRASLPLIKLIESALANAMNAGADRHDTFLITNISVDKGIVLKRYMPRARGRAFPIRKRSSHVTVVIEPGEAKQKKAKKSVKTKS